MEYTQIHYDVDDSIATITLHRPERMNAFTDVDDARDDRRVRSRRRRRRRAGRSSSPARAIGHSAPAPTSEAGGDTFAKGGSDIQTTVGVPRDGGGMVSLRIFDCKKPVIGAINGAAVGVGVTMTLPMDIRLASDNARFGFVFARRGIVPEACSSWFLPRLVGISTAAEWCYTGRVFPASEALERGLVRSVHAPDELLPAAIELAREIADNTAPVSVALTRQMLWRMLGADHPMEAHRVDSRGIQSRGASADAKEGVESFLEKRAPVYPVKVSDGLPDLFVDYVEPEFH